MEVLHPRMQSRSSSGVAGSGDVAASDGGRGAEDGVEKGEGRSRSKRVRTRERAKRGECMMRKRGQSQATRGNQPPGDSTLACQNIRSGTGNAILL